MFKSVVPALAAAVLLSPAALAEGRKMVTLTHTYDTALVSNEAGAAELLADLTGAAERVCTSRVPMLTMAYTDADCVDELVVAAVRQIQLEQIEAGSTVAPSLERIALTQLASIN